MIIVNKVLKKKMISVLKIKSNEKMFDYISDSGPMLDQPYLDMITLLENNSEISLDQEKTLLKLLGDDFKVESVVEEVNVVRY